MKREVVDAMTDDELRIKAAELIGWTSVGERHDNVFGSPPNIDLPQPAKGEWCTFVPDYPNDITAAWELIDRLVEMEFWPNISAPYGQGKDGDLWSVQWNDGWVGVDVSEDEKEAEYERWTAYGDTAPRTITRAFIIAMGENNE